MLENGIFDVGKEKGSVRLLFQSLGVKYHDNRLSFTNSNRHTVPVRLGDLPFPKAMEAYASTGFVRQNHSMLEILTTQNSDIGPKLKASAIFIGSCAKAIAELSSTPSYPSSIACVA